MHPKLPHPAPGRAGARRFTLSLISAAVLSALAGAAAAAPDNEADEDVYELSQSVVSAAGFTQDLREAPASMSVISSREIEQSPAKDLGDIVAGLPGIEVEQTKMGNSTIDMRGFGSSYTLFMVDGKRQNSSDAYIVNGFNPNSAFVMPTAMIDRVEVIRGPASTLYGSDAIGGMINVITKKHPEELTGSLSFETQIQEHKKFGDAFGLNGYVAVPVLNDTLSFSLRGRYYDKDATQIKDPAGNYLTHSANSYNLENYGVRVSYSPTEGHDLYADFEQYDLEAGAMRTSSRGIATLRHYKKDQLVLNYDGALPIGDLNAYFQYYNHETEYNYDFYNRAYIGEAKLVTPFEFERLGALNLTSGLQFWHDRFRDDSSIENGTAMVDIGGKTLIHNLTSAYLEGEYFITQDWIATVGGRYTYSSLFDDHITPRAYLVNKTTRNLTLKGGVAAGYRTPSAKELTDGIYSVKNDTQYTYGNPDLKPETSVNYELTAMYELPRVGSLTLTGFLTNFKDKLDSVEYDTGAVLPNGVVCTGTQCNFRVNKGRTRAKGIELMLSTVKFDGVSFKGSYTYTDHRYRDGEDKGKSVNAIPRHAVMARLDYEFNKFSMFLKGTGKFHTPNVGGQSSGTYSHYRDYIIVDLGMSYRFTDKSRLNFTVNNLFDKDFYDDFNQNERGNYFSYYRDYVEGRNYYLNYTLEF